VQRVLAPRIELIYGKECPISAESRSLLRAVPGKEPRGTGFYASLNSGVEDASWTSSHESAQAAHSGPLKEFVDFAFSHEARGMRPTET
jgi:hypothetical protein